ncbi:MAG: hypothetical protein OCD01_01710 [Fibrobacterales bacterium]
MLKLTLMFISSLIIIGCTEGSFFFDDKACGCIDPDLESSNDSSTEYSQEEEPSSNY